MQRRNSVLRFANSTNAFTVVRALIDVLVATGFNFRYPLSLYQRPRSGSPGTRHHLSPNPHIENSLELSLHLSRRTISNLESTTFQIQQPQSWPRKVFTRRKYSAPHRDPLCQTTTYITLHSRHPFVLITDMFFPLAKTRLINVRLISMAMTGFFYTFKRPRTSLPMGMLKYDPIGTPTTLKHYLPFAGVIATGTC